MEINRYGQYFKSAIDYKITEFSACTLPKKVQGMLGFIETGYTGGYVTQINKKRLHYKKASKKEMLENPKIYYRGD